MHFPAALLLALALALALTLAWGASGVFRDDGGCKESSSTCDRLARLERLLTGQNDLIRHLQSQLSQQKQVNLQQDEKLSRQESLLVQQERSLGQLREEAGRDNAELQFLKDRLHSSALNSQSNVASDNFESSSHPASYINGSVTSVPRDVVARSDDAGPLEVVVSHMGQQLTEVSADIQALKNANHQQDQQIQDARTSTFVHWGSSQCSSASQLVYSGVVGGSFYAHYGGASNYLCLTMSPVASNHSVPAIRAYLYGSEYETHDSHMNKDPVCSVCRSSHSTTVMVPGTNVCSPGWHRHYSGFLMAGRYTEQSGSEYICVDSNMESRAGTDSNSNGRQLVYTATVCGSLPCGPYVTGKVVTCAVCSL